MSTENLIGQKLANNYRVDRLVGQGGMAQVYYGWDESLDRPVAIKVIGDTLKNNKSYTERFIQEARAVAKWRHQNILQVYYAGAETDQLYYFVMEFVDGSDLEQILRQYETKGELIPFDDVIRIGRAVANALDYAHSKHVIHRDVKPSNIMIDRENRVVLTDFGLAMDVQRGSMGQTFGTPHYVSPEQARNSADAVPQSDFYSLGIILYEMLTGLVPFDDPSSMSVALKHLSEPPPPPRTINPALSAEVEQVLLKALSKEPSSRFANGQALMDALEDALRAQSEQGKQSMVLPPLPSGMAPAVTPRPVSRLSVFDNLRLSAPMPPPQMPPPPLPPSMVPPTAEATPPASTPPNTASLFDRIGLPPLALGGLLILLILGAFVIFGSGGNDDNPPPTSTTEVAEAVAPTAETIAPTAEAVAPTAEVVSPTAESVAPTAEVVAPTAEVVAPTAEASAPTAEATFAFPNGRVIELFYNSSSLYLYNGSGQRVRTGDFSFESLDAEGRALRWFMQGNRWSQFYSFVDNNNCVGIEPFAPPGNYLRPSLCRDYNSTVTPEYTGEEMFWLARPEAVAFRVLWNNNEVGRCALGEGNCVVTIP